MNNLDGWVRFKHARVHIANGMVENGECSPDFADRLNLFMDSEWLEDKILHAFGTCVHEHSDTFQQAHLCNKPSVAFCCECGVELCREHIARANNKTVCMWCERSTN